MDREAWRAVVHGVAKSQTWLSNWTELNWMVTSKRTYAGEDLLILLRPAPPSLWWGPVDLPFTGHPPAPPVSFVSVSCGITAPFLWVFVCRKFCLCPSSLEYLFPLVLWKSSIQILDFKVRFPVDSQSFYQISRLVSLTCGSEPSQEWENFFGIIVLQFVGPLPSRKEIWF